jgi:hypothetical protein
MARPLRLQLADALYQATPRGDRREDIFADEKDRLAWGPSACRSNLPCLLLDNEPLPYHGEDGRDNLASSMRQLNFVTPEDAAS